MPRVGLNPTMPQNEAGRTTEPLVWLPTASGTCPAATAAAEPLDDPPGVRDGSWGLDVADGGMKASCVLTVLPMMTAPASLSLEISVASSSGRRPCMSGEPHSVGMSAVSTMSLMPTGMPCRDPSGLPARRIASQARACSSA